MIATPSLELYAAALHSDATAVMQREGFADRIGRKRFVDLIDETYLVELKVIVQLVRWYEIGLVKPGEIDVPHPALLMIDLRRRIQAWPNKHVSSYIMDGTFERMVAWWCANTITTAWRSAKIHVRVTDEPADALCDAVADFLWDVREALLSNSSEAVQKKEVQS